MKGNVTGRPWRPWAVHVNCLFGMVVLNNHLYAVGGQGDRATILSSVERYDAEKDQWEAVASMSIERCGVGAYKRS